MVFFCLGNCGGFWDAVEEVSVLMNGDVEKEKLKKEKKKNHPLGIYFVFLLGPRLQKYGAQALWHGSEPDIYQQCL